MFTEDNIVQYVYQVDVVDLTPGIQDPRIFVPPPDCQATTYTTSSLDTRNIAVS